MSKMIIGVSSRENSLSPNNKELIKHLKFTCGIDCDVIVYQNNGVALSKVYNEIIKNNEDCERFVFLHDDIKIVTMNWGREINKLFDENPEYGIIGVAGSKTLLGDCKWWAHNESCRGKVIHELENQGKFLTVFSFPCVDIEEVCCIDGLFIAFDKTRIKHRFDEDFKGFHFYDINFSLDNFFDGVKVGVTNNVRLIHKSGGDASQPMWIENKNKTIEKYRKYLPIKDLKYEIK